MLGFIVISLIIGCTKIKAIDYDANLSFLKLKPAIKQLILVQQTHGFHANLTVFERKNNKWIKKGQSISAVIGRNGVIDARNKQEGDMKTPSGLYSMHTAFGTKKMHLKVNYKLIDNSDKFIDDPNHEHYNRWIHGPTNAKHFENMFISEYSLGLIIDYNMHPTIPNAGSAIFIHIWNGAYQATHGCIALDKHQLKNILLWIDKTKSPYVYIRAS